MVIVKRALHKEHQVEGPFVSLKKAEEKRIYLGKGYSLASRSIGLC